MLSPNNTKEGALNEKLALKKLLTYMTSVYKILQKIKYLSDKRERICVVFRSYLASFHGIFCC